MTNPHVLSHDSTGQTHGVSLTKAQMTDLDLAEELIVSRLKRYAARTARHPTQAGLLKADKAISIIRERFSFVRNGRPLQRERGKGERAELQKEDRFG